LPTAVPRVCRFRRQRVEDVSAAMLDIVPFG